MVKRTSKLYKWSFRFHNLLVKLRESFRLEQLICKVTSFSVTWPLQSSTRTSCTDKTSRRLTSPPCVCSRGTNHMPNVRQALVPSEPHPHHLMLCTVLSMFMCVTVRSKSLSWEEVYNYIKRTVCGYPCISAWYMYQVILI